MAALRSFLGELDRIQSIVKVSGYTSSAYRLTDQANVMKGASDLLVQTIGEQLRHARTSVGVSELSSDIAEVELAISRKL